MHDGRPAKDRGKALGSEGDVAVEKVAREVEEQAGDGEAAGEGGGGAKGEDAGEDLSGKVFVDVFSAGIGLGRVGARRRHGQERTYLCGGDRETTVAGVAGILLWAPAGS